MGTNGLQLAPEKTEEILLIERKKCGPITFNVQGCTIRAGKTLKYLRVALDPGLTYNQHVEATAAKAEKLTTALITLRVCGAYRTTSRKVALVIAGLILIELLVEERILLYQVRREKRNAKEARKRNLRKWEEDWQGLGKGACPRRLIKGLINWHQREHGEVSYYVTQLFTGHGSFGTYLHTIGKTVTDGCRYCGSEDTPERAFLPIRDELLQGSSLKKL